MNNRILAAEVSLEGLSVADALASWYEFAKHDIIERVVRTRQLPPVEWRWTDDTAMACSIVACLREFGAIDQDWLADHFAANYERKRGYGRSMRALIQRIRDGASWREETHTFFNGAGSYGNGGAMRVAPLGAYFADDLDRLMEQARLATEVTHAHPEGIVGAQAVALAAAHALNPQHDSLFEAVIPYLPASNVRTGIIAAQDHDFASAREAAAWLGNGTNVSAQDTVPYTIWCANRYMDNYEQAIWATLSGGGDCDTTCAIVGGIVVLRTGIEAIPQAWRDRREPLKIF